MGQPGELGGYLGALWPLFQEAAAKERLAAGEEIWSYTALCQGSPDTPFWELDFPILNYRIPVWISWRFGITGLLYCCFFGESANRFNRSAGGKSEVGGLLKIRTLD